MLGLPQDAWGGEADRLRTAFLPEGLTTPRELPGPAYVVVAFVRPGGERRLLEKVVESRSVLVLTNAPDAVGELDASVTVLGPTELGEIVDSHPEVRRRLPSVLGVRDLTGVRPELRELARVFVPTRAYARTLEVLERHRFAVLNGPPEMGKTAIARMLGLALATEGWEVHECLRPDELWAAFRRERAQLFVADDAFGSTEYRPDAAERWALDLDRALQAMDERHMLVWTSRPTPLRAALRRIHREHGVERWPQPAEVHVAADELDVEEKALILFRHAQAARLPSRAIELVETAGWQIVAHPHFTPERIRRFVAERLPALVDRPGDLKAAVDAEIREPTTAMAASLRALGPEHRALLVALLDTPPAPVPERELAHAVRRHSETGFSRPPAELVDRLTDHFLHVVPPTSVTWVHPSWRDLVIEALAAEGDARRRFLERCSLDGLLLALSVGGGATGERRYPLLVDDGDWDAATDRLVGLVPELEDTELFRLLAALAAAAEDPAGELPALAASALDAVRRCWDRAHARISATLLGAWFAAAARLPGAPHSPELAPTWIELVPTGPVDPDSRPALVELDEWLSLVEVLERYAPDTLGAFGFPDRQLPALNGLKHEIDLHHTRLADADHRALIAQVLTRLARVAQDFRYWASMRASLFEAREERAVWPQGARPAASEPRPDRAIVARILSDLRA